MDESREKHSTYLDRYAVDCLIVLRSVIQLLITQKKCYRKVFPVGHIPTGLLHFGDWAVISRVTQAKKSF